jgi:hypothetical protein
MFFLKTTKLLRFRLENKNIENDKKIKNCKKEDTLLQFLPSKIMIFQANNVLL